MPGDLVRIDTGAWNKDDTTAMAAVGADDGSLIHPVGVFAQGRDEIVTVFVKELG